MCAHGAVASSTGAMRPLTVGSGFIVASYYFDTDQNLHMLLSQEAMSSGGNSKALKFLGCIQGQEGVIPGSSSSFINVKLSSSLSGFSELQHPIKVQVANGQVLQCSSVLPAAEWSIQGTVFVSDLRVLHLPYYDMIIGMDWLESHSPMKVDWLNKWVIISHEGKPAHLQGLQPTMPELSMVEVFMIQEETQPELTTCYVQRVLPGAVQQLLKSFEHLFAEPQGSPPNRSCDHSISLVEGAQPVSVRPYRLSPAMKDEVEQQIKEMLASGIIQPSQSTFSSPVLLVKKKNKS
jgi:hypothetical protein